MLRTAEGIATPYGTLSRELAEFIRETRPELLCPPCRPRHRRRIATATAALIGTGNDLAAGLRNLPPRDPPLAIASAGSADLTTCHKAKAACTDIGLDQGSLSYGRRVLDLDQTLTDEQQIYR